MNDASGPFKGYHVAVYAMRVAGDAPAYVGFYKICASKPASYWGADCLLKGCTEDALPNGAAAAEAALRCARDDIANLPHCALLPASREGRPMFSFELRSLRDGTMPTPLAPLTSHVFPATAPLGSS